MRQRLHTCNRVIDFSQAVFGNRSVRKRQGDLPFLIHELTRMDELLWSPMDVRLPRQSAFGNWEAVIYARLPCP